MAVARAHVSSRLLYGPGTWHSLSASGVGAMEDTCMAPFRTIANERWRPGHVPASSQEVCRRLGILDFREAVSMQRLRLAARLVSASPSLMALLQSDAGRAWKAELFCDIELLRQEQGPQLVEVESLSDFEKLWCDFPQAWKLLVSSCQRKLVERRQWSEPPLFAPVHILPTFSCGGCDAVFFTLSGSSVASNESPSATAGSTPLRPRLGVSRLQGGFSVETEGHSASGGGSETMRFGMQIWNAGAVFG